MKALGRKNVHLKKISTTCCRNLYAAGLSVAHATRGAEEGAQMEAAAQRERSREG